MHLNLILTVFVLSFVSTSYGIGLPINERGFWEGNKDVSSHSPFDSNLARQLVTFFNNESAYSIGDFGCGTAEYVKTFRENQLDSEGYDGNPFTPEITNGLGQVLDLSQPKDLQKQFDWVLSLEVGEHLPPAFERIFIENLDRHNTKGIVLSWAIKGQGGHGHVNEQNNNYIKRIMAEYGYSNDLKAENELRAHATFGYFKKTLMVFRKIAADQQLNYETVELLPIDLQGWYSNAQPIELLIDKYNVKTVVEVGSWKGLSTCHIAKYLPYDGIVYAVDSWLGYPFEYYSKFNSSLIFQQFLSNVIHQNLTHKIVPVRMESLAAAKTLKIIPDLIYLDGNHEFDAVYADLVSWFPLVKGHGILCGDDWGWTWTGLKGHPVQEAVTQFAYENNLKVETNGWFWRLIE